MSREIKFRQFFRGKFHYWGYIDNGFIAPLATAEAHDCESGQYTGLHDKNGKEIYELDIISDSQGKGIVYWIPEFVCFGVQEIPDRNRTFAFGKGLPIKNGRLEETEIIGNIYESKHLLEPPLGNNAEPIRKISEDDWRKDDR